MKEITMNQQTKRYTQLVKNLLTGHLSVGERSELNAMPHVEATMQKEWSEAPEQPADAEREKKILNQVIRGIRSQQPRRQSKAIYRYSWAASLALLLVCGALATILIIRPAPTKLMYVVHSGRQTMDSILLPDGSSVMLNAGSQLTYPESFTGNNREVTLSGQAFFNVHEDAKHPFIIKTQKLNITALGTSFEVFSFDQDNSVETILLTGKIKVETKSSTSDKVTGEYILMPNQKLSYAADRPVQIERVNANNYSAWRLNGRLSFKNEKLSMIIPRLEKWYGQKIYCPQKTADHYRFTFTVHTEPLDLILNIMSNSTPLSYALVSHENYELTEHP